MWLERGAVWCLTVDFLHDMFLHWVWGDLGMERTPEVLASTRDEALIHCTKPSGVPRGPYQLHISLVSVGPRCSPSHDSVGMEAQPPGQSVQTLPLPSERLQALSTGCGGPTWGRSLCFSV